MSGGVVVFKEKDRNRKGKCRRWEHNQEHCEGNIKGWLVGGRSKRGGISTRNTVTSGVRSQ